MNFKDISNFIHNIEKELPVDTWQYANIKIWPLLRIKINREFFILKNGFTNDKSDFKLLTRLSNNSKKIFRYMNNSSIDVENNAKIVKEQGGAIFCSSSTARRAVVEGRYYDIYCDPFIEQLKNAGIPSLVLEKDYEGAIKIPRYNKSKYVNGEIMLYVLQNSYKSASYLFQGWHLPRTEKRAFIHQLLAVGLDGKKILEEIPYDLVFIKLVSDYYKSILQQVKPMIAFVVACVGFLSIPFVLACRQLKIPIVDIQIGMCHIYEDFLKVPTQGYELLPNYFWCWNEKKTVFKYTDECDNDIHKTIYGGNLWIKKWKEKPLSNWILEYDQKFNIKGNNKFNILYTVQIGQFTPQYLIDIINSSPPNWLWWIRLHPGMEETDAEVQEIVASIKNGNVIFEEATSLPLLSLLRNVDVHVTQYSATVLEAEEMNVPSIIMDERHIYNFKQQISSGTVLVGSTYEKLFDILNELKKKDRNIRLFNNEIRKPVSVIDLLNLAKISKSNY